MHLDEPREDGSKHPEPPYWRKLKLKRLQRKSCALDYGEREVPDHRPHQAGDRAAGVLRAREAAREEPAGAERWYCLVWLWTVNETSLVFNLLSYQTIRRSFSFFLRSMSSMSAGGGANFRSSAGHLGHRCWGIPSRTAGRGQLAGAGRTRPAHNLRGG